MEPTQTPTLETKVQDQTIAPKTDNVQQQTIAQPIAEDPQTVNWKKFREEREKDRKAKEEAVKRANDKEAEASALKAAMEAILNKNNQSQSNNSYDSEREETEEDRIAKHVEAALKKRDDMYEKQRAEREYQEFPQRLNSTYSDFEKVCCTENLDYLEFHYPEVAEMLAALPQGYDRWSKTYRSVKKLVPNVDTKKDILRSDKNNMKPQSLSNSGISQSTTPAASAFRLDEQRKAENWARMQKTMNQLA